MCNGNSQTPITLHMNQLAAAFASGAWNPSVDLLPALQDQALSLGTIASRPWNGVRVARKPHEVAHIDRDFTAEQQALIRSLLIRVIQSRRVVAYDWQPDARHNVSYRDTGSQLGITFHGPSDGHAHTP